MDQVLLNSENKPNTVGLFYIDPDSRQVKLAAQSAVGKFKKAAEGGYLGQLRFQVWKISKDDLDSINEMIGKLGFAGRIFVDLNSEPLGQLIQGNCDPLNEQAGAIFVKTGSAPIMFIQESLRTRKFDVLEEAFRTKTYLQKVYRSYWEIIDNELRATSFKLSQTLDDDLRKAEFALKFQ